MQARDFGVAVGKRRQRVLTHLPRVRSGGLGAAPPVLGSGGVLRGGGELLFGVGQLRSSGGKLLFGGGRAALGSRGAPARVPQPPRQVILAGGRALPCCCCGGGRRWWRQLRLQHGHGARAAGGIGG
jgi:hypothetical protein